MARDLPARTVLNGLETATNGRDARGRFVHGNPGGGRPPHANVFARYQAELRGALLAEVHAADLRAVMRTVLRIAKHGHLPAVELLLKWTLGAPPAAVDGDRLDEHEWSVKRGRPTLIDQLALADDPAEDDPEARPATADDPEPSLRTVLAWAIQELAEAKTALQAAPQPPPDPAAGWEAFASDRLEWDTQAAVPMDLLFVTYARWCAAHGEPVLAEEPILAWLTAHGATVRTGALSHITAVEGVRVVD